MRATHKEKEKNKFMRINTCFKLYVVRALRTFNLIREEEEKEEKIKMRARFGKMNGLYASNS